jgi:hypothetical protein
LYIEALSTYFYTLKKLSVNKKVIFIYNQINRELCILINKKN